MFHDDLEKGEITLTARYHLGYIAQRAEVAELVDALVSGTSGAIRGGSSPLPGTRQRTRSREVARPGPQKRGSWACKRAFSSNGFFRMMVSSRSGPVETKLTGIPAKASIRDK